MAALPRETPQFQLVLNSKTGYKTGRIYFPQSYISGHTSALKSWLEQKTIYFTQEDVKLYSDGSFRLYFEAPQSEYERLHKTLHP